MCASLILLRVLSFWLQIGVVTTLAGNGKASFIDGGGVSASFSNPFGVAVDDEGFVYCADCSNHRYVWRAVPPTTASNEWCVLCACVCMCVFPLSTQSVRKVHLLVLPSSAPSLPLSPCVIVCPHPSQISPSGMVSTLAGNGICGFQDGRAESAQFNYPHGVALDAKNSIYVADYS